MKPVKVEPRQVKPFWTGDGDLSVIKCERGGNKSKIVIQIHGSEAEYTVTVTSMNEAVKHKIQEVLGKIDQNSDDVLSGAMEAKDGKVVVSDKAAVKVNGLFSPCFFPLFFSIQACFGHNLVAC
jgi:hypothetical protein